MKIETFLYFLLELACSAIMKGVNNFNKKVKTTTYRLYYIQAAKIFVMLSNC